MKENRVKVIFKKLRSGQRGVTLMESVIALAVLGLIAVAILSALATGAKASMIAKEQATAESLARSEVEYVKRSSYDPSATTYPIDLSIVPTAEGWTIPDAVVAAVPSRDASIQMITVTVSRHGEAILSITDYKANR